MPSSARMQREWFEQAARPTSDLAKERSTESAPAPIEDLLRAARYLRYDIAPATAEALVKARLGARDRLLSEEGRQYLKKVAKEAEDLIRAQARPADPPGCKHQLTGYEERRLVREYRELTRFLARSSENKARRRSISQCREVTLAEVNAKLADLYPADHFSRVELREQQWLEILKTRSPRQRAIQVLSHIGNDIRHLYPLGLKGIETLCYEHREPVVAVEAPTNAPSN